ncbi:hypothetical protein GHT06_010386 [Daphnia sinensis]|uniref:Calx-beta domain-containing protein n=1 Tax=Daphnia sinensis TaxID=1820382 RepID=A0AAD5LHM5_9CRUS|nr:hypothetical protein GHT06_010386 [Daphnia sinensis]
MAPFSNLSTLINSSEVAHKELLCSDGILLPAWLPLQNVGTGTVAFRGLVYIASLIYLFVGVAILADKFMASIEMITSKKKEVKVKDANGKVQTVVVRVWNETVANLTLMALGCSCPEILLSSIEIIGKGFEAGEMGPGSTVGSAAFNLFVIIGVCNWAIPSGQARKIKRVSVFLVTAAWSIFAYLWLYLITAVMSPGVIEVWEALITFAFFPLTVLSAYIADRHVHIYDYISKTYRMGRNGVIVEMTTDETEIVQSEPNNADRARHFDKFVGEAESDEVREFENHRKAFIILLKNLRRKYPMLSSNQLELMATKELLDRGSKSKAFYQVMASKMLLSGRNDQSRHPKLNFTELFKEFHPSTSSPAVPRRNSDKQITKVFFSPGHYTVMENVGHFDATVVREDGDLEKLVFVDYVTEDGDATAGKDFEANHGTLCFEPGVTSKTITIKIIDDQLYEEDQHFYIRLLNIRSGNRFEYLCGKGEIADDAYMIAPDIHNGSVPSYSMTLDVGPEEPAPPRYSVTAREILSALKSNKNLRRPSWFHYDESDAEVSTGDDDVFVDAASQLDTNSSDNPLFHEIQEHECQTTEAGTANKSMTFSASATTLATSVSYSSGRVSLNNLAGGKAKDVIGDRRKSVEFLQDAPTSRPASRSRVLPDSEDDSIGQAETRCNHEHSQLRLVFPSMATVMILDDDHRGIFSLAERSVCLTEAVGTHCMLIIRIGGSRGRVALSYRTEEGTAKPNRDYHHCQGEIIFEDGETEKSVPIQIIGESLYEKDVLFYFIIGEPKSITDGQSEDGIDDLEELSMREYSQLTEQQRVALRGRAQLGEVTTAVLRLKESKQFKNTVDKMVSRANKSLKRGTSAWLQQFIDAIHFEEENEDVHSDEIDGSQEKIAKRNWRDYASHGSTVFWRLVFAIIPPECMGGGYPCFFSSVVGIGIMTALIGDVASHLGCTVGLKDSVTALAFVSLGTSLPDLFASKVSAVQDQHADASISNVTGANAVNVFLGVGVAWTLAAFHHSYNGTVFYVEAGTLAFSVTLYCIMALFAVLLLMIRRCDAVGGELGGPLKYKLPTTVLLIGFFILYILLSSLEAYEIISGF